MRMTASPHVLRVAACLRTIFGDELFPVIIWLSMFGATRLAPALVPRLSMAFPQVMDVPRLLPWQRRRGVCDGASSRVVAGANSISVAADAAAARLAELIRQTPFGTRSDSVDLGGDISSGTRDAALRASWWPIDHQFLELLVSLVTYPRRLWTYILFRRSQPASLRDAASATHRGRNVRSATLELLLRTMTSFTSTWVHASGNMLFNTLVTYLSARIGSWGSGSVMSGGDRRHNGFRNGWRDLLVASCVSTGLNLLLQTYWVEALTSFGELRALSVEVTDGHASSPSFSGRMQLLSSAFSRLGSIESLYHLSRLALRMQPNQSSSAFEGERVYASPPSSSSSSGAGLPQLNRVVSSSQTTSLTPARAQAQSHPAHVYLCGGSVFIFALSGFRFTYYNDPQQLTTAVSNFMTDALSLVLRQAQKRAAAQNGYVAGALLEEQVWRPPVSSSSSSYDVVLAPVASLQLLPLHVLNFAVGAGVGLAWRERRLLVALRRVPLLRHIVELVFPLPPLPLKLPEVLQELSPERHVLLVQPGGKVEVTTDALPSLPIVKADTPDLATATVTPSRSSAEDLPSSGVTSIVVAQDLFCPIKRTLMCDPVQTVDGFTYDRDGIEEWLWAHDTAPLTNLHLDSMALRVNWQARQNISRLVDQYTAAVASSGGAQ
ncbi:hypothetical protein JKF63_07123 [Porcisia hertigi]|uniref:U-box domain-containing protein n=1 Tax=Porcisia hertigi TaxID=2761500 RepID=A0A836LKD8_9TRYP|nr:hypothetical protein JKF63_07123 [Porcisia hertigi]